MLSAGSQCQCDHRGLPRSEPLAMGRRGQRGRRGRLRGPCVDIRRRRGMNLMKRMCEITVIIRILSARTGASRTSWMRNESGSEIESL